MIQVYIGKSKPRNIEDIQHPTIRKRIERIQDENEKNLRTNTYIHLLSILKEINPNIQLDFDELGKPILLNSNIPLYVSISHSKNVFCFALSSSNVGIDIEKKNHLSSEKLLRFYQKCLSEEESKNTPCTEDEFYRLWTIKESYVKLLGIGFRILPNEITVRDKVFSSSYSSSYYTSIERDDYQLSICSFEKIQYQLNIIDS